MNYSDWNIPPEQPEIPRRLTEAGYTPLLAALLARRGLDTPEAAESFLHGGPELLGDPLLLEDMDRAAARLRLAIERRETVAVFGDYDVDGITSACLVTSFLRAKGLDCEPYIPDRMEEGYGLNLAAMDTIKARGARLIVTVDCGITAAQEAGYAASLGMDMVITDHHECGACPLPAAVAVVDPKRPGSRYPNADLAGVGVAFKLLCAVEGGAERVLSQYADLIATGTIADVMPLTGENRYIVRRGLAMLAESPRPGIRALLEESGALGRRISASTVGFTLAPRLNAAGRLGRADVAVRLLLTRDEGEAARLAAELCRLNRERQEIEHDIYEAARRQLSGEKPTAPIVLAAEGWHQGVIGIAASKLAEEFSLPTVMICLDGDSGKGSCRSCGDFNLFDALSACSGWLEGFGGHALAAGAGTHGVANMPAVALQICIEPVAHLDHAQHPPGFGQGHKLRGGHPGRRTGCLLAQAFHLGQPYRRVLRTAQGAAATHKAARLQHLPAIGGNLPAQLRRGFPQKDGHGHAPLVNRGKW